MTVIAERRYDALHLWLDTVPLKAERRLGLDGFAGYFDLPELRFHPRHPGIPPGIPAGRNRMSPTQRLPNPPAPARFGAS
ncbi:hypothetical protein [Falsiroseomonas sp. HW251]|uniref:hypothetical protein n=1 Tax=Falsiroseomonas sp. HW251 TaxID=3390998 RepID=UPI003D31397C